jgi:hypothetical protein
MSEYDIGEFILFLIEILDGEDCVEGSHVV